MYYYTYRITNIIKKKHYYGVRSSKLKPEDDLGFNYFSSSKDKDFIRDQKENPQNFKYKVIKIFKTRKNALEMEIKLHSKFDVGINENFYNKSKQTSTGFDRTGVKPHNFGKKHKSSTINKMIKNHKGMLGKKFPQKSKENMSKIRKGSLNPMSNKILIYSKEGELMFECNGDFKIICDNNNLPYSLLMKSYKNNSEPILENISNRTKSKMEKLKRLKFVGWYATKH